MTSNRQQTEANFTWLLNNERFVDVIVLIATNESIEAWRNPRAARSIGASQDQPGSAKRARKSQTPLAQADDAGAPQDGPDGLRSKATRTVLGSCSDYFCTRISRWDDDPLTLQGTAGHPLLVVEVESELHDAAQAVIHLMYKGTIPEGFSAEQLAKMCRVADMWGATMCMAKCLTSLAQQKDASRTIEALSAVLSWLPDSASACPGFTEWESQWGQCVVEAFNDVHALLTDLNQLQRFRKLPFQAVRAWADSDELVVDSENSVAVALSWWCGGDLGSQATEDQLKVLSGLLRVARLTHAYRLTQLRELEWFKYDNLTLHWITAAAAANMWGGSADVIPAGWLACERTQVNRRVLQERTAISWDVPRSALEAAMAQDGLSELKSPPVYAMGSGLQLLVEINSSSSKKVVSVFVTPCTFTIQDVEVACSSSVVQLRYTFEYKPARMHSSKRIAERAAIVDTRGLGAVAFTVSTPAELDQHLSGDNLKVTATFDFGL